MQDLAPYQPLMNAAVPQVIPTYDGTDQPTHPSVVKFDQPWHGYKYWMVMTPYPFNDGSYENPSIVTSNDGENWAVPEGVTNPLVGTPNPGHNCDADLVYVPELDELRIYYVEADDIISSRVKMMSSRDGVQWSEPVCCAGQRVCHYPPAPQSKAEGSALAPYRTKWIARRRLARAAPLWKMSA